MTVKYYTGVGSRKTPPEVLDLMTRIARNLQRINYVLRSGGAPGADQAFQAGVTNHSKREIYIPWEGFQNLYSRMEGVILPEFTGDALTIAAHLHPAWDRCSQAVRKLHARNINEIVGPILGEAELPSDMLICWTPNGEPIGGTATAIKLAELLEIPVFNFGKGIDETLMQIEEHVNGSHHCS